MNNYRLLKMSEPNDLCIGVEEMNTVEEWKTIQNFENYEVSTLGNVRNKRTGHILKSCSSTGYSIVVISNIVQKSVPVHRLVCQAFIPNPENKPHVNHKDKNKLK